MKVIIVTDKNYKTQEMKDKFSNPSSQRQAVLISFHKKGFKHNKVTDQNIKLAKEDVVVNSQYFQATFYRI